MCVYVCVCFSKYGISFLCLRRGDQYTGVMCDSKRNELYC